VDKCADEEAWDILDEDGNKSGRFILRRDYKNITPGEYHLVVHILIKNVKGKWLIQKRSPFKEFFPNVWAVTGGSVLSGENSLTAAIREVEEEIGITLCPHELRRALRYKEEDNFVDVWIAEKDFSTAECTLQESEVADVKWVDAEEFKRIVWNNHRYLECIDE
jgi:8-oxo-dGTP pyrophosphatase MutT (NUDIX family)